MCLVALMGILHHLFYSSGPYLILHSASKHQINVVLMLVHRLQRWSNLKTTAFDGPSWEFRHLFHQTKVVLLLVQRLRRWPSNQTPLFEFLSFLGRLGNPIIYSAAISTISNSALSQSLLWVLFRHSLQTLPISSGFTRQYVCLQPNPLCARVWLYVNMTVHL